MSSGPDRDEFLDYVEDRSSNEDETLFLPAHDGRPDGWTVFYVGILTGLAGGSLFPISLWLGAALIFLGYGATVLSYGRPRSKIARAMRFGFGFASSLGGFLLVAAALFPDTLWRVIEIAARHHLVFLIASILPWAATFLRYSYILLSPQRTRRRQVA